MEETTATTEPQPFRGEDWFDPLEGAVRERIRGFIEEMLEGELDAALQRRRYDRRGPAATEYKVDRARKRATSGSRAQTLDTDFNNRGSTNAALILPS